MFLESMIGYSVTAALSTKSLKKIWEILTSEVEAIFNPTNPSVEIPELAKLITNWWNPPLTALATATLFWSFNAFHATGVPTPLAVTGAIVTPLVSPMTFNTTFAAGSAIAAVW